MEGLPRRRQAIAPPTPQKCKAPWPFQTDLPHGSTEHTGSYLLLQAFNKFKFRTLPPSLIASLTPSAHYCSMSFSEGSVPGPTGEAMRDCSSAPRGSCYRASWGGDMRFRVLGIGFREGRGEGVLPVQQTGRGEGVLPVQQHYPCFCKEELMRTYVHIHYIYIYM